MSFTTANVSISLLEKDPDSAGCSKYLLGSSVAQRSDIVYRYVRIKGWFKSAGSTEADRPSSADYPS
jgi:hypothetical protein